ncbi:MAG: hypothetical protein SCJ93_01825 [Bacillota bacterium]|nr:hypothetical protein [Bacillota bacterium]
MFKFLKDEKGSVLIIVLIVMVVMVIFGTTLATVSMAESKNSIRHEKLSEAHYVSISAAEAVADYFISNQKDDAIKDIIEDIEHGSEISFPNENFPNEIFGNGIYEVSVKGQPGSLSIESTGTVKEIYQKTNTLVISNIFPDPSWGEHAIASKTLIEASGGSFAINGSIMSVGPQVLKDSQLNNISGETEFNSDQEFPEVPPNFDDFKANLEEVNGVTVPDVDHENDIPGGVNGPYTFIDGYIYNIGINAKGNSIELGGGDQLTFSTGNDGDITVLNLEGGISQSGTSKINFNGEGTVIFYVNGNIDFSGGTWNQVIFSGDVLFYVTKSSDYDSPRTIVFSGNTSYSAHIIAPDAQMTYNGGGSNMFRGKVIVEYFKGHGSFSMVQEPESSTDFNPLLVWPWIKNMWYN